MEKGEWGRSMLRPYSSPYPHEASDLVILSAAGAKDLLFCRREPSVALGAAGAKDLRDSTSWRGGQGVRTLDSAAAPSVHSASVGSLTQCLDITVGRGESHSRDDIVQRGA